MQVIKERDNAGIRRTMVVHYEYSYNYNPETTLTRVKTPSSDNNTSLLNLLSHTASAVMTETETTVSLSSLSSSSSPPPPPPPCNTSSPISPALPVPSSNFAKMPDTTAAPSSATPPTTITTTTTRSPLQHAQTQTPSILAVFPQFSPSASACTLPMPPGMEITLAHSHSNSHSHSPTATPFDEKGIRGDGDSLYHRKPKATTSTATSTSTAARGKVTPFKTGGKQSRYTMKYHYVSMRRWEAHQYIESLARDSAYRYHGHHYDPWIASAAQRVVLNTVCGCGCGATTATTDPGSGRFPKASVTRPVSIPIPIPTTHSSHSPFAYSVVPPY